MALAVSPAADLVVLVHRFAAVLRSARAAAVLASQMAWVKALVFETVRGARSEDTWAFDRLAA